MSGEIVALIAFAVVLFALVVILLGGIDRRLGGCSLVIFSAYRRALTVWVRLVPANRLTHTSRARARNRTIGSLVSERARYGFQW